MATLSEKHQKHSTMPFVILCSFFLAGKIELYSIVVRKNKIEYKMLFQLSYIFKSLALCPTMWPVLENVSCVVEKNVCFSVFW